MRHLPIRFLTSAVAILVLCGVQSAVAVVPPAQLMPMTTKGYLSIPDVDRLQADFDKTQLGQLLNDPVMKPFSDDLRSQLKKKWRKLHEPLGLTWDDMQGVPGGEVGMGRIQPAMDRVAQAIIIDVTGKQKEVDVLLAKIDVNFTEKKAKRETIQVGGLSLTVYTRQVGADAGKQAIFFVHPQHHQLVAVDDMAEARNIIRRFGGDRSDSLAGVKAYQVAMARTEKKAGDIETHMRWFLEPFGYIEARRIANPDSDRVKRKGKDLLDVLKNQGFTAIQGLGGSITLHDDAHDILHRTAIYAPGVEREAGDPNRDKYDLAMRMLTFPNKGGHAPPRWIPRDLATFVSLNADLVNGFEYAKTLVNELADDEIFEDVIRSLKEDPNGPRIDVRKEVVANLGEHIFVMSDYELPITTKSERLLAAIELTNVDAVRKAVDKTMENDPNAVRRMIAGHSVWEIVEEQAEVPDFQFEFDDEIAVPEDELEEEDKALPASAVCVAHGHLLIGSHVSFIRKVLEEADRRRTLAGSVDFQLVEKALTNLGADSDAVQTFSRTDEEFRSTYELMRQGKMPQSESMMGKLLNAIFDDGDDETVREQQIDAKQLPEYQMVRRYLGPAGMFVTSLDDGWVVTGCFLSKETLQLVLKSE